MDKRAEKLAKLIVEYSLDVKKGDIVLLDSCTVVEDFIDELYKQILLKGAIPFSNLYTGKYKEILLRYSKTEQLSYFPPHLLMAANNVNSVIDIENDLSDINNVSPKKREIYAKSTDEYWNVLLFKRNKLKRLTLLLPAKKEAEDAGMSFKEFEDFIYSSSLIDWNALTRKMSIVNSIFEKGKEVHLIGENVDLKFSIKGRNSVLENGKENMPGGEIFMAPIKDSLEGWIRFEFPASRDGLFFDGIYFKFKKGKIIEYDAKKGKKVLKSVLDTDEGARYVGEFAVGINPKVNKITGTWVDEKMDGTVHFAIGKSYEENGGDNESVIHIDFVKDMKKAKIILDGKVLQENGKWKLNNF